MLKETIIVASNVSETEKLKSRAFFQQKTFNTRYFSIYQLALYLLQKSGVAYQESFITDDDLAAFIYPQVKSISYFNQYSYRDILSLIKSVNDISHYIVNDEKETLFNRLPHDKFVKKNEAIKKFYQLKMDYLKNHHLIDELEIIRLALKKTKTFNDIDFVVYEGEKTLSYPLDMALINKASGEIVKPTSIYDGVIKIHTYLKAFSQVNEIEYILNYIYQNKIPFDQCLIASAETVDYASILNNYHDLLGFPLVIATGQNIINTNPGRLYSLIADYKDSNYHGDYLKKIIFDQAINLDLLKKTIHLPDSFENDNLDLKFPELISFDSIIQTLGDLRLTFDARINEDRYINYEQTILKQLNEGIDLASNKRRNKELGYVKAFIDIFNQGEINFINRFTKLANEADNNALDKIIKALNYQYINGVLERDIRKLIYSEKVSYKKDGKGSLYFTSINKASSSLRKHLFIVGLASINFPGNNKEDANIFDQDYLAFDVTNASSRLIERNKNDYFNLIKEASLLDVDIHLSYAFYNSITLKNQNASSVIFETYKLENGFNKTIKNFEDEFIIHHDKYITTEYFETPLLPISEIARKIKDNHPVSYIEYPLSLNNGRVSVKEELKKKPLSASSILLYAECPYQFYLSRILRIPQKEEIDIFSLIPPNDLGSLAHSLLEGLEKKKTSKIAFLDTCKERYLDYFKMHHTDNHAMLKRGLEDFLDMMDNAYEMEAGDVKKVLKEEDLYYSDHNTGLIIHGLPDEVIRLSSGEYFAVDYKTGGSKKHFLHDINSLIQCIVYCYILERKRHYSMKGFEYRYIKLHDSVISDKPMNEYYNYLEVLLTDMKNSFDSGEFLPNLDYCSKCYYRDVCRRKK